MQMDSFSSNQTRELRDRWEMALKAEDCVQVRGLLDTDRSLLEHPTWETGVQASLQLKPRRVWKGRTALHVAARRGDVALVNEILQLISKRVDSLLPDFLEILHIDYELNALAMAVINGNRDIVNLLKEASLRSEYNPYDIVRDAADRLTYDMEIIGAPTNEDEKIARLLASITEEILAEDDEVRASANEYYSNDCNFNFLYPSIFLFHFTFSTWQTTSKTFIDTIFSIQERIVDKAQQTKPFEDNSVSVLDYLLLELRDGQGRTALHVAVDSQKVARFLHVIGPGGGPEFLNVEDGAGRTPLFRALSQKKLHSVRDLLEDQRTDVTVIFKYEAWKWGSDLDLGKLSWKYGFRTDYTLPSLEKLQLTPPTTISYTALHLAMMLKFENIANLLVSKVAVDSKHSLVSVRCDHPFTLYNEIQSSLSTMELSVLMGYLPILEQLLKDQENEEKLGFHVRPHVEEKLASYFWAAATGKLETVKILLDSKGGKFDPLAKDKKKNTALHHALKGNNDATFWHPCLLDFVSCDHVLQWRVENGDQISHYAVKSMRQTGRAPESVEYVDTETTELSEKKYGQRTGCINLLLEEGINIWERNMEERIASPAPDAPEEFVKWWYEKVAKVTEQERKTLNGAANAVTVTAAIVATASYVGPFTPPLGFGGDPLSIQEDLLAIRIFVVCDTISFFLALAAIMLAIVPSLPISGMSISRDLVRTRMLFAMAVSCLFPSIICVLMAFAAAYTGVVRDDGLAHHGFSVGAIICAGSLCFLVIYIFANRWVQVIRSLDKREGRIFFQELFPDAVVGLVSTVGNAVIYRVRSVLYILGSVLYIVGFVLYIVGSELYIVPAVLYVVGALIYTYGLILLAFTLIKRHCRSETVERWINQWIKRIIEHCRSINHNAFQDRWIIPYKTMREEQEK